MSTDNALSCRLEAVKRRIEAAGGRNVAIVAVTKTVEPERINELASLGVIDIGENRVQEWLGKKDRLDAALRYHHIGRLQTNKVKYIAGQVFLVHSVDSVGLLQEISKYAENLQKRIDILIQLNLFGEPQKGGVSPDELPGLLRSAQLVDGVRVRGLMGIAPDEGADVARAFFKGVREWYDRLRQESLRHPMDTLSMGMSGDYQIAVEEGANMVRIGTALFS